MHHTCVVFCTTAWLNSDEYVQMRQQISRATLEVRVSLPVHPDLDNHHHMFMPSAHSFESTLHHLLHRPHLLVPRWTRTGERQHEAMILPIQSRDLQLFFFFGMKVFIFFRGDETILSAEHLSNFLLSH